MWPLTNRPETNYSNPLTEMPPAELSPKWIIIWRAVPPPDPIRPNLFFEQFWRQNHFLARTISTFEHVPTLLPTDRSNDKIGLLSSLSTAGRWPWRWRRREAKSNNRSFEKYLQSSSQLHPQNILQGLHIPIPTSVRKENGLPLTCRCASLRMCTGLFCKKLIPGLLGNKANFLKLP